MEYTAMSTPVHYSIETILARRRKQNAFFHQPYSPKMGSHQQNSLNFRPLRYIVILTLI